MLSETLTIPDEIVSAEPVYIQPDNKAGPSRPPSPISAPTPIKRNPFPTPQTLGKKRKSSPLEKPKPWSTLETGLSAEEEKADPALAAAIRESLWASQVDRMEVDDDGKIIRSPSPMNHSAIANDSGRPPTPRSVSAGSTSSTSSTSSALPPGYDEPFSLEPSLPAPITHFALNEDSLDLDAIMSCIPADELRRVAKARKIPPNLLVRREDVCSALRGVAKRQTVLGFAPVKGKESGPKQATLPFGPKATVKSPGRSANLGVTSESLLIAQLLPLIGQHAIQLTLSLHNLISRVNLIFSRTPPVTAATTSLLLPSILVSSHRRRYPDYGPPTRSKIWSSRDELLRWERAVKWEAVVQDALGESWQEMRKAATTGGGPQGWGGPKKEMLGRVEGSKVVKRIWEGVWPIWTDMVEGSRGYAVDVRKEEGGLVGDRFKTGASFIVAYWKKLTR